ncbi:hypothetical protein ACXZ3V_004960, partial [Escherichia coli]
GVNVTVTATPYFAQIRQNCLPESGKFARFFDHHVSVSFCAAVAFRFAHFFAHFLRWSIPLQAASYLALLCWSV